MRHIAQVMERETNAYQIPGCHQATRYASYMTPHALHLAAQARHYDTVVHMLHKTVLDARGPIAFKVVHPTLGCMCYKSLKSISLVHEYVVQTFSSIRVLLVAESKTLTDAFDKHTPTGYAIRQLLKMVLSRSVPELKLCLELKVEQTFLVTDMQLVVEKSLNGVDKVVVRLGPSNDYMLCDEDVSQLVYVFEKLGTMPGQISVVPVY